MTLLLFPPFHLCKSDQDFRALLLHKEEHVGGEQSVVMPEGCDTALDRAL